MITITDINGNKILVTDLDLAIEQCKDCLDNPFKMASDHTVGENRFMLHQLERLQKRKK